jgi:hypothetical protein
MDRVGATTVLCPGRVDHMNQQVRALYYRQLRQSSENPWKSLGTPPDSQNMPVIRHVATSSRLAGRL